MKDSKIPMCPECESKQVLTNKDGSRWCRRCGHKWDSKQKKEVASGKK